MDFPYSDYLYNMIIYAIPGLGTNEKLFANTKINAVEIIVLNWPIPEKTDTMKTYAQKFLPQINTKEPFCLLGVSFGGMLCCELSTLISPKKTFLISTVTNRNELPFLVRALKYIPIHNLLSEKKHRQLAYHGRWAIGFGKAYIPEFLGMVNSMTKNYFKHSIHIICNWKQKHEPKNCIRIHGTFDRLFSYKKIKTNYLIKEGSHAMVLFNAEEINKIIENEINQI